MFPHLPKVFEKNKFVFGHLLDTLNYYLIHGRDTIVANRDYVLMLIGIAKNSLFSTQPTIAVHNSEGAILFQLIFQIMSRSNALDEFIDEILNQVMNRMTTMPMHSYLKRHLLLVFVSAMAYSPNSVLSYLERNQLTEKIFSQIVSTSSGHITAYERKIFILGLSNVLYADQLPQVVVQNLLKLIQEIVKMLNILKQAETKELKQQSKKEIKRKDDSDEEDEDEDDEEDYDDEDDDDEDEEDEEDEENTMKDTKPNAGEDAEITNDEEVKGGEGTKPKGENDTDDDNEDDDDEDDEEDEKDELYDLSITMDLLQTPMLKVDEFKSFQQVMDTLHKKDPVYINNILGQLTEQEKKILQEHMQTQRIKIESNGQEAEVARRVIKVKRRGGPSVSGTVFGQNQ